MKIERPKKSFDAFKEAWDDYPSQDNEGYQPDRGGFKCGWFSAIDWILSEAVEVYSTDGEDSRCWARVEKGDAHIHKALLINIEEIKKETAEDLIRELRNRWKTKPLQTGEIMNDWCDRAEKVLNEKA